VDPAATRALAAEFMAAVRAGDGDRLRAVYHPDVRIWHTFDGAEQDRDANIRTLRWMFRHVSGLRYDEVRVAVTEDGFVQQHVMRAERPSFEAPCMLRAWCSDGRITRLEEYLDSAHTRPLTEWIKTREQLPVTSGC
jgi:ketosteroid isomerase-like protein